MSRDEISDHCLCDKCSGDDCEGLKEMQERAIRKQERERVLDNVIADVERMIDAEQERGTDGHYSTDSITKLGMLAYVSEHFKSLRQQEKP